jgi:hypothetical protein
MNTQMTEITYPQAKTAYEAGRKIYQGGRVYLVQGVLCESEQALHFWIADERTRGDHGFLLYPDGRIETK